MSVAYPIRKIEKRLEKLERDMKRVKEMLELATPTNPLNWQEFDELDKNIFRLLYKKKFKGASTTEIACELGLSSPEKSGRVIIWKRIKKFLKVSKIREGFPMLIKQGKRWALNFDDYTFDILAIKEHVG